MSTGSRALGDRRRVEHPRLATSELHRAPLRLPAQHAVDRRPRGTGQAGDVLLRQRNRLAVQRGELADPPQHPRLRADEERLDEELALAAQPPRAIRWSVSAGSSRWKTTSLRPNRRRRATAISRRISSCGSPLNGFETAIREV